MALVPILRWKCLDEIMVSHYSLLERHNLLLTALCFQTEHADYLVGQIKQQVQSITVVVHGVVEGGQAIVLPIRLLEVRKLLEEGERVDVSMELHRLHIQSELRQLELVV